MKYPVTQYTFYWGVLYFQNVTSLDFLHVNIMSFFPKEEDGFPCAYFHETNNSNVTEQHFVKFEEKRIINLENMDGHLFTSVSKM